MLIRVVMANFLPSTHHPSRNMRMLNTDTKVATGREKRWKNKSASPVVPPVMRPPGRMNMVTAKAYRALPKRISRMLESCFKRVCRFKRIILSSCRDNGLKGKKKKQTEDQSAFLF